jgi:hypothetical protein
MRGTSVLRIILGIVAAFNIQVPLALAGSGANDPNRYLNAVREFADNLGEADYERDMLSCRSRLVGLPSFGLWQ